MSDEQRELIKAVLNAAREYALDQRRNENDGGADDIDAGIEMLETFFADDLGGD